VAEAAPERRPGPGDRVVVRTQDRRDFRGVFLELRDEDNVVVRLDTGWLTTYPRRMVFLDRPEPTPADRA
jgi:hypothetical protein